ncbi:zinc knuckle (CCHC-type) family protein [Striga asiatica]|uniref:Zinc knuckle (CCHC-type) family protein n=1 Tax=Striga asiatica TaxID=4170 RepID=A0A5A7QSV8_STRAF|nr:zinc knuckle (CCHC-type) family protein [Striga asiatica]
MAGLQRSAVSFRRQGSSGLVWDDKLLSGELAAQQKDAKHQRSEADVKAQQLEADGDGGGELRPAGLTIPRSRSNGGFRTGRVSPAIEPPSPRVSACGFCGAFGKDSKTRRRPPRSGKRVA